MGRFLAVIVGLIGAIAGSQAPGYTLQFMQNLTGRIDELRPIVEQFDRDVAAAGYTRTAALEECETASGLTGALCGVPETAVRRFELLSGLYADLDAASDYVRPLVLMRSAAENDFIREIGRSVMKEFKPTVQISLDGLAYAGGGFAVGWGVLSFLFGILGSMFGGRRRYA